MMKARDAKMLRQMLSEKRLCVGGQIGLDVTMFVV